MSDRRYSFLKVMLDSQWIIIKSHTFKTGRGTKKRIGRRITQQKNAIFDSVFYLPLNFTLLKYPYFKYLETQRETGGSYGNKISV